MSGDHGVPNGERHTGMDLLPPPLRRFAALLAAMALGVAAVGFFVGIRERPLPPRPSEPAAGPPPADVPAALSYAEIGPATAAKIGARRSTLADLKQDRPGAFDAVIRTEEMKLAALADRARHRAFDGAPPTVPHPADGVFGAACLACHGEGLRVGDRVASKMSHPLLTNCSQCHAAAGPEFLAEGAAPVANGFVGLYRAGPGVRAGPGAPPTMPHHQWMRQDCLSCHGLVTRSGTRTTHPWLTNCTQCHAPGAALDQADFAGAGR